MTVKLLILNKAMCILDKPFFLGGSSLSFPATGLLVDESFLLRINCSASLKQEICDNYKTFTVMYHYR